MALTQEQIELRFSHLGGSDFPRGLLGKWGGEAALATEKQTRTSWTGNDYTAIGDMCEGPILDWVLDEIGWRFDRNVYREVPGTIIGVNIDGLGEDFVVEAKTVIRESDDEEDRYGEPGTDEIPAHVTIQVHAEMLAANVQVGFAAVWILGKGKFLYRVSRDEQLCQSLIDYAAYFQEKYMIRFESPELDETNFEHAQAALSRVYREPGKVLAVTDKNTIKLVDTFAQARTAQRFTDTMEGLLRTRIMQVAQDAGRIVLPDGRIVEIKQHDVHYKARAASTGLQTKIRIIEPKGRMLDGKSQHFDS